MKDKILMLIIGILIGAVITAGGFLLFGRNGKKDVRMEKRNFDTNMIDGGRSRRRGDGNNIGEPPTSQEGEDSGITSPSAESNT